MSKFVAQRAVRIHEELQLGTEIIELDIDPSKMVMEFKDKHTELVQAKVALERAQKMTHVEVERDARIAEAANAFGAATVSLFVYLFGEEHAAKIFTFYENNYVEMLMQLMPFINDIIMPQMMSALSKMRSDAQSNYGGSMNRKARRSFAKKYRS